MVKLAIWNSDYISAQSTLACQPGGMPPPGKSGRIKVNLRVFLAAFQWKIMEFQFIIYHSNFTFSLDQG